jgi:hypothetical protein
VLPHLPNGGAAMTRASMRDAALAAAGRGWPVFPLRPGRKRPRPELTDWEPRATVDPERIEQWWARHPTDNIAIATGPAGLVVVDLDQARIGDTPPYDWPGATGGADVLDQLAARHGQALAPTWTVHTASGGRHLYYWAPEGAELRNTAGRAGWKIDTRAGGGYVVAARSTVGGRPYVVIDDTPPVELPHWLAQLVAPSPSPPSRSAPARPGHERGYATAALRGEVQRVLDAPPGTRNAALNRAAWNLARHIATGLLARPVVEDVLCEAGRAAGGQTPAGVAATVRSAIDARLRRRPATGAGR